MLGVGTEAPYQHTFTCLLCVEWKMLFVSRLFSMNTVCHALPPSLFLFLTYMHNSFPLVIQQIDNGFCSDLQWITMIVVLFTGNNTLAAPCCTIDTKHSHLYSHNHIPSPNHPHTPHTRTTPYSPPLHAHTQLNLSSSLWSPNGRLLLESY